MSGDTLLSIEEAAQTLNVSVWTVRRLCHARELGYRRVGRLMRVPESELRGFLRRGTTRAKV